MGAECLSSLPRATPCLVLENQVSCLRPKRMSLARPMSYTQSSLPTTTQQQSKLWKKQKDEERMWREDCRGKEGTKGYIIPCFRRQLDAPAAPQFACRNWACSCADKQGNQVEDTEEKAGVKYVLGVLRFYKREISPYLPGSCRYVPTCSVYAQEAYKKYGVIKGTILTTWRLARCNPLGGTGFDPPRWFDEEIPPPM